MTIRLVFPDPLEWQSGLEWGVEAAAVLIKEGYDLKCVFRSDGPMFEAVAFAAFDLGVLDQCIFDDASADTRLPSDIVIGSHLGMAPPSPGGQRLDPPGGEKERDGTSSKRLAIWAAPRDSATIAAGIRKRFASPSRLHY